jgi:pimeloyl-ACP methyl ester carboxylesterase
MQLTTVKIPTSHGTIAMETVGQGFPILFIHGNSACRHAFRRQLDAPRLAGYRRIVFDLPGHGDSDDAPDPGRTYSRPGLADCVLELVGRLGIPHAAIVGASLGGHVAIEMLARSSVAKGLFLMGTPAVGANIHEGFIGSVMKELASQGQLTSVDAQRFTKAVFGASCEPFMAAVARTDRRFRSTLFAAARQGAGVDQRATLAENDTPVAIVNGEKDQLVNLDYIDSVPYANLWRDTCFRIAYASHSPYWDAADETNELLADFLKDLCGTAA